MNKLKSQQFFKDLRSIREMRSQGKPMPPTLESKTEKSQFTRAEISVGINTGTGKPKL